MSSANIADAVSFLREPAVQAAPLEKRLEFLRAKGLKAEEIEASLSSVQDFQRFPNTRQPAYYSAPYPTYQRDWRDWFIMAVIGSGLGYVATQLTRKYVLPALQPPTDAQHKQVQDALEAKYEEAAQLLAQLKQDTEAVKTSIESQQASVDAAVTDFKEAVADFKVRDAERSEEIKACKEEVDSLKELLPKAMEKNKEAQFSALAEIQTEIKSLKSLLASQQQPNGRISNSTSSPDFTGLKNGRAPGLPSWQLAASPYQHHAKADANETTKETNGVAT